MKPVIALVGRPNVGKSTLFNCLTRSRDALVANQPGLTRDRQYGEGRLGDFPYIVVDTGGITEHVEAGIETCMREQSLQAIQDADIVLFLVDAKAGVLADDLAVLAKLRKYDKNIQLVINKIDRVDVDEAGAEFSQLGLQQMHFIAASHKRGVAQLMHEVFESLGFTEDSASTQEKESYEGTKVAVIGRPNVGKSTLVNRLLGEDRVVVYDQPGTTRDSVYIPYTHRDEPYVLIDTAGVRRKGKVKETVEKFSVVKTLQAISNADVVVVLIDGSESLVDQDIHLLGYALDVGRAMVIAVNKWDGLSSEQRNTIKEQLQRKLHFVDYVDVHYISALHGTGVGHIYNSIKRAHASAQVTVSSSKATAILERAIEQHQPPLVQGRRIKLRYAHVGGAQPPVIVIHGNQVQKVPHNYTRYLENVYRSRLKLVGTPINIVFKAGDNPYAGRKNQLTSRQLQKRRRMMRHVKKR